MAPLGPASLTYGSTLGDGPWSGFDPTSMWARTKVPDRTPADDALPREFRLAVWLVGWLASLSLEGGD